MSVSSNAKDLMFFSGFTVDKIVRVYTGSYKIPTNTITRDYGFLGTQELFRIPHDLGRPVATDLQWSIDNVNWREGGVYDNTLFTMGTFSDKDYIYIIAPYVSSSASTFYYRVYCRWIDDFDNTNPSITAISYNSQPIQFDSRKNFQKAYEMGVINFTAGTGGATQTVSVPHTLGYAPNAKVWVESFKDEVWLLNGGGLSNLFNVSLNQDEYELTITNSDISVKIFKYSNQARRAWYRIYYDAD